jgi:hypothetical protein
MRWQLPYNQVPVPLLATYICGAAQIGVGLGDNGSLGEFARVGNEIRATGLKVNIRVMMQHNATAGGTLSTWNGEQRVRLVVGRYMGNGTTVSPATTNVLNQYPSVFYGGKEFEQEEAAWGRFPQYRNDPADPQQSPVVAKFKIIYQKELVFNSFTIRNGAAGLLLAQDGTNVNDMTGIPTRKPYVDYQTVNKFIPLDHKILYSGNDPDHVRKGAVGVWIVQHDATSEYGTPNLNYFGHVSLYYKDG